MIKGVVVIVKEEIVTIVSNVLNNFRTSPQLALIKSTGVYSGRCTAEPNGTLVKRRNRNANILIMDNIF